MTKAQESGENEWVRYARQRAARTGEDVCAILRELRQDTARRRDKATERKIIQAEKFLGCRNMKKRSGGRS